MIEMSVEVPTGNKQLDYFEGRRRELGRVFKKYRNMPRYYRGPLAEAFGRYHILLLTTTGRRSGLPRVTALTFMPMGGSFVVGAGLGGRSDWYQNLLANPTATLQVGRRHFLVRGEPVLDPARRRLLVSMLADIWDRYGPPSPVRWLMRRLYGFDYDREVVQGVANAEQMPIVLFTPISE
jgi:deazaflavin-dependent oxidoreductase (nitroreductase family)